jgi:hypothetical protein
MMTSVIALNALNFFMADVRDGFGPFLGVLLQGKSWSPEEIGLVMTIGGHAGVIAIRGDEYLGAKPRRVVHHNKLGRPMSQMGPFWNGTSPAVGPAMSAMPRKRAQKQSISIHLNGSLRAARAVKG